MGPDFGRKTKDVLAKFAAYRCSNPTCGVLTVGPNKSEESPTSIGQAAHIYGARPSSARYDPSMTDASRAEITNGIWLCSNCHKKVDDDEKAYPADLLFRWREKHETVIAAELGDPDAMLRAELGKEQLAKFILFPSIVKRIAMDKPPYWEWRLTAELMRHLNGPHFRRLRDLRAGLYTETSTFLDEEDVFEWLSERCREMEHLIEPLTNLLPPLNAAWGEPGEEGDADEILHITTLIKDALERVVFHEEDLHFVRSSTSAERLIDRLQDAVGRQLAHFEALPDKLDEAVALAIAHEELGSEEPLVIDHTLSFELPENWSDDLRREMARHARSLGVKRSSDKNPAASGCVAGFFVFAIAFFLVVVLS